MYVEVEGPSHWAQIYWNFINTDTQLTKRLRKHLPRPVLSILAAPQDLRGKAGSWNDCQCLNGIMPCDFPLTSLLSSVEALLHHLTIIQIYSEKKFCFLFLSILYFTSSLAFHFWLMSSSICWVWDIYHLLSLLLLDICSTRFVCM